jgi:putative membrane-bound dehydrogenase-like protein
MEREREILDQMTANRDERIWALARGEVFKGPVTDDNTLPFHQPTTNVGLPDDPNAKKGKLGQLDYLTAAEQQKKFELAPGYEINLVASEEQFPELANPVSINFDNKGRLWVATMASYPHWKPKTKLDDKILILEDDDNDGKADRCKVFADALHQPTGFEIGDGGAYVAVQPDILFMKDTDGDDKADFSERRLTGFDSADSHHGLAAFQWGPGGVLYFQEGTFKFSQVESPYGLTRLGEAGIWKYNSRTEKFGAHVSFSFSNPWGHIFDRWGQDFIGDASGGLSYWAAPISGHVEYPMKHPGGSHDRRVQEFVGKPKGFKYKTLYKKRIRPLAGCELVSSRHFPDDVQGNWLVTNCIGERTVLNHKIEEKDSGFWGTEAPAIVSSSDGNFRPVDVEFAPDGSLYIVDWHNALIGHLQHNLRDPSRDHSHGRIWRVTYKDRPLVKPAKIDGAPISDLLELLKVYEDRTRGRAKRELAQRDSDEVIAELGKWIDSLDKDDPEFEHQQLEALWIHQMHNRVNENLLDRVLGSKDHRARAAAVRVLSFWLDQVPKPLDRLKKFVGDPHPRVRLESVRALSFLSGDEAIEVALEVLNHEMDYYLEYTLDETMRVLEQ